MVIFGELTNRNCNKIIELGGLYLRLLFDTKIHYLYQNKLT
jgi:hypothetical protein